MNVTIVCNPAVGVGLDNWHMNRGSMKQLLLTFLGRFPSAISISLVCPHSYVDINQLVSYKESPGQVMCPLVLCIKTFSGFCALEVCDPYFPIVKIKDI